MRDYTYPKVPNYYHESVGEAVFNATDLRVIEKLDGSNCKLCVFDSRYKEFYGDDVGEHDPEPGDVLINSKTVIRGKLSDPLTEFDGVFHRLVRFLREQFNSSAILELHEKYDSPLMLFGEHMIPHTLDYEYTENPPPPFIGFDVLQMSAYSDPPPNPFDERFDAFLRFDEAWDVFESTGLETAPVVTELNTETFNRDQGVESVNIPVSAYGDMQAEGVVFRSDEHASRVKLVTEAFRERAQEVWGSHESDVETGAELFCARYVTNARIQKTIHKHAVDSSKELTVDAVSKAVIADAWTEELSDVMRVDTVLCPSDVFDIAMTRCEKVLRKMRTNSELNDVQLESVWTEFRDDSESPVDNRNAFNIDSDIHDHVHAHLNEQCNVEKALVELLVSDSFVNTTANNIAKNANKSIGRWVIVDCYEELNDMVWYRNIGVLANLRVSFTPQKAKQALLEHVKRVIEARDDVTVNEKPESDTAEFEISEDNATGFETLF